ncbi:hypothetical protein HK098_004739 [Nowakowskiella sp. JEL0407]|nr:hypothetical protein HK098_004739 [Nowakowskiella sp. JEL0407]
MASTTSHHSDLEDQVRLLLQQHDQEMNQQQQNQQTPNDNTILDDNVPKESATSSVHPSSSVSNIPVSPENLNSVPNTNPSSSQASHSALQPYQNSSIGTSTSHASTSLAQNSSSDRGSNLDHSSRTPPSDRASNLDTSRHGVHAFFGDLISSPGLVRADLDYDDDDYQELRNITGESTSSANYGGEFTGEFSEGESEDELEELNTEENKKESENLLTLLYSIAEDQARKDGFVHRSITCNHCTTSPIRGFRYKCLNCVDFDLCESCEALNEHIKTHVFIKIRIPIPPLMNPRSILLGNLYPGKEFVQNGEMPEVIGTHFDKIELEAFYAQYLSLSTYPASSLSSTSSPSASGITKPTFLQCLGPLGITQNLISDRIFAFFDRDKNGVIDFEEFCHGLSVICKGSLDERIKYAFEGYDLDANGIITKSELRKMFKAYFYLSMELVRDVVKTMEEGMMESFDDEASRPVSSAFLAPIPTTGPSNHDESNNTNKKGKEKDDLACLDESPVGDYLLEDGERSPKRKLGPIHLDPYSPLHLSLQDPSPLIHLLPPLRRRSVQMSPLNPIIDSDLEEEHWPVMETMSQDAIEEMVERTFNSAGLSDEDGIDFEVFKKVVEIDSNLLAWFEALGSVF